MLPMFGGVSFGVQMATNLLRIIKTGEVLATSLKGQKPSPPGFVPMKPKIPGWDIYWGSGAGHHLRAVL